MLDLLLPKLQLSFQHLGWYWKSVHQRGQRLLLCCLCEGAWALTLWLISPNQVICYAPKSMSSRILTLGLPACADLVQIVICRKFRDLTRSLSQLDPAITYSLAACADAFVFNADMKHKRVYKASRQTAAPVVDDEGVPFIQNERTDADVIALHKARLVDWTPTAVTAASATADGTVLAVARESGNIELWQTEHWHLITVWSKPDTDIATFCKQLADNHSSSAYLYNCSRTSSLFSRLISNFFSTDLIGVTRHGVDLPSMDARSPHRILALIQWRSWWVSLRMAFAWSTMQAPCWRVGWCCLGNGNQTSELWRSDWSWACIESCSARNCTAEKTVLLKHLWGPGVSVWLAWS